MDAYLALEDGTVVEGEGHGAPGEVQSELVFTTQYTGYEESLTDPSYAFQTLMFTYPLIGNYGVDPDSFQSDGIKAEACVAREFSTDPPDVLEWFEEEGVPAMSGVDTRALTVRTREHGTMRSGLIVGEDATPERAQELAEDCPDIEELDLGARVTREDTKRFEGFDGTEGTVALIDCGCKNNIITSLRRRNLDVVALPYDVSPGEVRGINPDSLFISNGPGDPAKYTDAVGVVDEFVFVDGAGALPRHVGGADVAEPLQTGALREQVEHVTCAVHVHLPADVPRDRQVVHRGEMHRLRNLLGHVVVSVAEGQVRLRDVAGEHLGPVGQFEVGEEGVGAVFELRLDEQEERSLRICYGQSAQEAGAEEARDASEEGHAGKIRK